MLAFGDFPFVEGAKVAGFHPGLVALIPNLAIAVAGSTLLPRKVRARADSLERTNQ